MDVDPVTWGLQANIAGFKSQVHEEPVIRRDDHIFEATLAEFVDGYPQPL